MKLTRRDFAMSLGSALCLPSALAQSGYPAKPIRVVLPYAAGGGNDVVARMVTKAMSKQLGQPLLVDNKPGAGTAIGATEVARAAPDGYTLLWGDMTTYAFNPFLYKKLSYSPLTDFTPISLILQGALILVATPSIGVNSVPELLAYAKANPGKLQYGSAGNASPHHLGMELLKLKAGLDMQHVPYKGEGPALNDLLGGHIHVMFVGLSIARRHAEAGQLKMLATSEITRNPLVPELPTVAEGGVPGFDSGYWTALAAPAKTPEAVIRRLNEAFVKTAQDPEVVAFLNRTPLPQLRVTTPQQALAHMQERSRQAGELIKTINVSLD